ncbi:MAG: capsular polysaccharide biosynthesis protein [Oscillospiraceae bacterium]|nr:capsular polysaccharide biosynthesis protein [Oscillospiraceae bacterium]
MIDAHIHILPGMDDGSDSVETSRQMLDILQKQGVATIIATPHFYAHREKSLAAYLEKREKAYAALDAPANMLLGAEVAIEHGISKLEGIEQLAIQGTNLILLEYPYTGYSPWMGEELHEIAVTYKLQPVIAHIHRYLSFYPKDVMEQVLKTKAIFQINNEAFGNFRERRFVRRLIKDEYPVIFGSDSHNLKNRKPNWDLLLRKVRKPVIAEAMQRIAGYLPKA